MAQHADFEQFVAARYAALARTALLLTSSRASAEDLLQEARLKTYVAWSSVRAREAAEAYVRTTMVRLLIRDRKRRWSGEIPHEQLPEDTAYEPDRAGGLAVRAARRHTWTRAGAAAAGVAVLAGGGVGAAQLLGGPGAPTPPAYAVAASAAPQCVRDQLAEANSLARRGIYSAVVVDLPGSPKDFLTRGVTRGYGWANAQAVATVHDLPGLTPGGSFRLWEGVTPEMNPAPGRYLMFLFLDVRPGPPSDQVGSPTWSFATAPVLPVVGNDVLVRCADGSLTRVAWTDASTTWLAPNAPVAPVTPLPPGAASTESPTS